MSMPPMIFSTGIKRGGFFMVSTGITVTCRCINFGESICCVRGCEWPAGPASGVRQELNGRQEAASGVARGENHRARGLGILSR